MEVGTRKIDYQVTISEELRALVRNRSSSESPTVVAVRQKTLGDPRTNDASGEVFADRKLRVDGQRPLRLRAAMLLSVEDDASSLAIAGSKPSKDRFSTVTLYLTEDDTCLMHIAVEPPSGCSVRPMYRSSMVRTANDVDALLRHVRSNVEAQIAVMNSMTWPGHESHVEQTEPCCPTQVARGIEPFLVTPINGR